jgi:hypothetical protein
MLQAIAAESKLNAFQPPPADLELPSFVDVWTPLVGGGLLHLDDLIEVADKILGKPAEDKTRPSGPVSRSEQEAQGATPSVSVLSPSGIENAAEHAAAERAMAAAVSAVVSAPPASASTSAHLSAATESSLAPLSDFNRLRSAIYEKHMKRKLVVAVDHFNKDHKKGLQFLQVLSHHHIFSTSR